MCDLESSIPDWLMHHPETDQVFELLQISTSCAGKSLRCVCNENDLDPESVKEKLETKIANLQGHRFSNILEFPAYAFTPGETPHPRNNREGHSFGLPEPEEIQLDPNNWQDNQTYLHGVDLFNAGYCWEAHEQWEALWHGSKHRLDSTAFLKGLIALAAAALKLRQGISRGALLHATKADVAFSLVSEVTEAEHFAGLEIHELNTIVLDIKSAAKTPLAGINCTSLPCRQLHIAIAFEKSG